MKILRQLCLGELLNHEARCFRSLFQENLPIRKEKQRALACSAFRRVVKGKVCQIGLGMQSAPEMVWALLVELYRSHQDLRKIQYLLFQKRSETCLIARLYQYTLL
ncbi:hypothetical protein FGO68_gene3097 [Halteria grandinella]|uniref:Uncharacterized protein n=1 Tax=Halteria grandinella TaxID=5974 RepID=A0A8J8NQ15_HALGN|nr:hypothetical protein FGO68_gene3097 [Halteria grandinella]